MFFSDWKAFLKFAGVCNRKGQPKALGSSRLSSQNVQGVGYCGCVLSSLDTSCFESTEAAPYWCYLGFKIESWHPCHMRANKALSHTSDTQVAMWHWFKYILQVFSFDITYTVFACCITAILCSGTNNNICIIWTEPAWFHDYFANRYLSGVLNSNRLPSFPSFITLLDLSAAYPFN